MGVLYVLYESSSGYTLFEVKNTEDIAAVDKEVQEAVLDMGRFSRTIQFKAFKPFESAESALENINCISEGVLSDELRDFLELNLPKAKVKDGKKKYKYNLGVSEKSLATAVQESLGMKCVVNQTVSEICRGVRQHFTAYISALDGGQLEKAQLGLGHSYSRAKVKFNVNRSDNMIIQAICLLDQLDKDLNTFAMRVREWYSWHFPELVKIVNDNYMFARLVLLIKRRDSL